MPDTFIIALIAAVVLSASILWAIILKPLTTVEKNPDA